MSDWQIRTLAEAASADDRPLDDWPELELGGLCGAMPSCNNRASHVATSRALHMRVLLCPIDATHARSRLVGETGP